MLWSWYFGLLAGGACNVAVSGPITLPFVLPYKRFAAPCLLALAANYLHRTEATYRSVVRHQRLLIGYPRTTPTEAAATSPAPPIHQAPVTAPTEAAATSPASPVAREQDSDRDPLQQAVVSPSLPWRFIGWLGCFSAALGRARELLLECNPNSTCQRVSGCVDPFKARSPERMVALETARQLLLIIPEWEDHFKSPFFPRFATRSGFD